MSGVLYLIPTPLGELDASWNITPALQQRLPLLQHFVVEAPKTARRFLKQMAHPVPLQQLSLQTLDEHTPEAELMPLLAPLFAGHDVGLLSEAGCPAVADPGARLVQLAHAHAIRVVPLVGPSALLLALMASGLNGQRFAFQGYLPAETQARVTRLRQLEQESRKWLQTQLFIETPYRNAAMFSSIVTHCHPQTRLCVATQLTQPDEWIFSAPVAAWADITPPFHKKPAVFLLLAAR